MIPVGKIQSCGPLQNGAKISHQQHSSISIPEDNDLSSLSIPQVYCNALIIKLDLYIYTLLRQYEISSRHFARGPQL